MSRGSVSRDLFIRAAAGKRIRARFVRRSGGGGGGDGDDDDDFAATSATVPVASLLSPLVVLIVGGPGFTSAAFSAVGNRR